MRRIAVLLVVLAGLAAASVAKAADPLTYTTITPADGAMYLAQPQSGIQWQMTGADHGAYNMNVRVSTSNAAGSDGTTLSDLNSVDFFAMGESTTDRGVYRGVSHYGSANWTNYPGTYYWQATSNWLGHTFESPIFKIVIAAPTPQPPVYPTPQQPMQTLDLKMTVAQAQAYLRNFIRQKARPSFRQLHYGCSRVSYSSIRCRSNWLDKLSAYSGTATFTHSVGSDASLWVRERFTGKTARLRCMKQRQSFKRCARPISWRLG